MICLNGGNELDRYGHPSVSTGDWFQDPPQKTKSADAQVPIYEGTALLALISAGSASADWRIDYTYPYGSF